MQNIINDCCNLVCMTPTRNEAWVIKRFLAAAKLWASHIIVADQGSSDGTLEELRRTPGVDVVINDSDFDEVHRQRLLINRARQVTGKRLLLALDADEALSANCRASAEWEAVKQAQPGTLLRLRWVNVLPGFKQAWIPPEPTVFGFIDDGTEHGGKKIHNQRVPSPPNAPVIDLQDVVVLHFQYLSWERMVSKHRWYQAWEYATHRQKGPLEIFRQYNHMKGSWDQNELRPLKPEWLEGYDRAGVEFRSLKSEPVTWWDKEVLRMLREHGPEHFRRLAIWDKDWNSLANDLGLRGIDLADPRSSGEKAIHRLLAATQKHRMNWGVRGFEWLLRARGW
jgi:hypothetical protein